LLFGGVKGKEVKSSKLTVDSEVAWRSRLLASFEEPNALSVIEKAELDNCGVSLLSSVRWTAGFAKAKCRPTRAAGA
jgi:hypothetical protein